jgi:dihydrofolate reductase
MFFKQQTVNNVVVMGRNTYDSLGKCLPNRFNIIVTHRLQLFHKEYGCTPVSGIGEALFKANSTPKRYKELFIMGGASMYSQFAGYVDRYLITLVEKEVDDGDTYLEPYIFGDLADWRINLLTEGKANPPSDEAAYEILELLPKDPELNLRRRAEAIEEFENRLGDRRSRGKNEGTGVNEGAEAGHRASLFDAGWEDRATAAGT